MTVKTKRNRGGAKARANGAAEAATPLPAAATSYACSVCGARRNNEAGGHANYVAAPNGARICLVCIRNREVEDMAKGRITLGLIYEPAGAGGTKSGWVAVAPSLKARFPLLREPGQNDAQVVATPQFRHEGDLWTGRLYKTGMVAFQRTKPVAAAAAKKIPRARMPQGVGTPALARAPV